MEGINKQKNENENNGRTGKQKTLFVFKIIGNVIFYAIIAILFIFALMNIRAGKESFPNIFGFGFLSVQSNSMERDNLPGNDPEEWKEYNIQGFKKGDLVISKTHSGDASDLKVGDVITWYDSSIKALNTHRIVYISEDKSYVIAQGDNIAQYTPFNKADPLSASNYALEANGQTQHVSSSQILGKATGVWNGAGSVLDNLQKNWLFYFVIPVAVLLLIELFFVFKNILDYRNEKKKLQAGAVDKDALKAELEAEKAKMREELLKEFAERGVILNNPNPNATTDENQADSTEAINQETEEIKPEEENTEVINQDEIPSTEDVVDNSTLETEAQQVVSNEETVATPVDDNMNNQEERAEEENLDRNDGLFLNEEAAETKEDLENQNEVEDANNDASSNEDATSVDNQEQLLADEEIKEESNLVSDAINEIESEKVSNAINEIEAVKVKKALDQVKKATKKTTTKSKTSTTKSTSKKATASKTKSPSTTKKATTTTKKATTSKTTAAKKSSTAPKKTTVKKTTTKK